MSVAQELPGDEQEPVTTNQKLVSDGQELLCDDQEQIGDDQELVIVHQELPCDDQELISDNQELASDDQELLCDDQEQISDDQELLCDDQELIIAPHTPRTADQGRPITEVTPRIAPDRHGFERERPKTTPESGERRAGLLWVGAERHRERRTLGLWGVGSLLPKNPAQRSAPPDTGAEEATLTSSDVLAEHGCSEQLVNTHISESPRFCVTRGVVDTRFPWAIGLGAAETRVFRKCGE